MLIWTHNVDKLLPLLLTEFADYTITVEFTEPCHDTETGWKTFSETLRMIDASFGHFIRQHIEYWGKKALVPVKVKSITYPVY